MEKNIDKLNSLHYDDYKENLMNISRLTSRDNSILFNFNIIDNKCINTVTMMEQSGDNSELRKVEFDYNEEFSESFLKPFIKKFNEDCGVVLTDTVDLDGDKKYTYRMITENNDLVTIDGISREYANTLEDMIKSDKTDSVAKQYSLTKDNAGISNAWALILIIIALFSVLLVVLLLQV